MNEALAIAEWRRAEGSRQVAHLCLQRGFYADAISRAYYATLHGAKSALALRDISTDTHRGVSGMFGLHVVNTGLVESAWGSVIGRLSRMRQDADYDAFVIFTEADAAGACEQADAFANRIHALLTDTISPELLRPRRN